MSEDLLHLVDELIALWAAEALTPQRVASLAGGDRSVVQELRGWWLGEAAEARQLWQVNTDRQWRLERADLMVLNSTLRLASPTAMAAQGGGPGGQLVAFIELYDVAPDGSIDQVISGMIVSSRGSRLCDPLREPVPARPQQPPSARLRSCRAPADRPACPRSPSHCSAERPGSAAGVPPEIPAWRTPHLPPLRLKPARDETTACIRGGAAPTCPAPRSSSICVPVATEGCAESLVLPAQPAPSLLAAAGWLVPGGWQVRSERRLGEVGGFADRGGPGL